MTPTSGTQQTSEADWTIILQPDNLCMTCYLLLCPLVLPGAAAMPSLPPCATSVGAALAAALSQPQGPGHQQPAAAAAVDGAEEVPAARAPEHHNMQTRLGAN